MSRTVRLKEHLAAEVESLAKAERRSLANMVEILLEQALAIESAEAGLVRVGPATSEARKGKTIPADGSLHELDPHFKPDPK